MDVIYFLIPLALLLLLAAIGAFLWAVRHNQFDNLDREAYRILFDEDQIETKATTKPANQAQTKPQQAKPDQTNLARPDSQVE